jgi:penicillin-binding protein 1B
MMVQVMERGTGRGARALLPSGLVVAGKSGTSSDYRDSWFAGFSGTHLGVVWIGYDNNTPTGLTGSSGSLQVWARLMSALGTTPWNAEQPETLQPVTVEFATGLVARPDCGQDVLTIVVPQGTELPQKPGCELNGPGRSWWDRLIH